MTAPPPSHPHIEDVADPAELFREAARVFEGMFVLERLVAADRVRALFVARHAVLKRRVALRVHLLPDTPGRRWFEAETVLLARLDHPGIRPVYSAGFRDAWAYRVSKWIVGESVTETVARGPRPLPALLLMARDLISALDYAHGKGVVLRRLVPTSVMLNEAGRVIVTDLRWASPLPEWTVPDTDPEVTPFMAPEMRGGEPGTSSGDLYGAAALLYFAATGTPPAANPLEIQPPSTVRPTVPATLDRVIMRALQLEPERRYLTADEMGDDLLSDLGDFEFRTAVAPSAHAGTDDPAEWEHVLRRAFGEEYELLDQLGEGGFGRVYRVRDLALEREVALKVLHPDLTTDPSVIERFRREARLAAQVRHPHIVDVYDYGGRAGLLWYTMAYVRGKNLATIVERDGPLGVPYVVRLLEQGLSALQHAHARGLVHRDLKPENVLVELPEWSVQITDFGLAQAFEARREGGRSPSRSGTPEFAAPEQMLGERVDERADLYSLTLVALFTLLGRAPLGGGPVEAVLARKTLGELPDLRARRSDIPPSLARVLRRGAAQALADRYPSADEYLEELQLALRRPHGGVLRGLRNLFAGKS